MKLTVLSASSKQENYIIFCCKVLKHHALLSSMERGNVSAVVVNAELLFTASPLRIFFKESLTRGPLRLCINEKTVRANDSPYFQFKGHTLTPPIPIKIIKNNNNKNRNTTLSDKVSD